MELQKKMHKKIKAYRKEPKVKMEVEPVEPVQMNIYQSNTYRKDFSWLNFDNEPRVQESAVREGPTVLHIHFSSLSNYLKSTHDNSIPYMTVW